MVQREPTGNISDGKAGGLGEGGVLERGDQRRLLVAPKETDSAQGYKETHLSSGDRDRGGE